MLGGMKAEVTGVPGGEGLVRKVQGICLPLAV